MDKFYKEHLESLSVYELRAIARKVGVKSPTTKKHKELVEGILKIQNGEEQAFVSSKGRPPKAVTLGQVSIPSSFEKEEGFATVFEHAKDLNGVCDLCASEIIQGINKQTFSFKGMLREVEGKKYIYNYVGNKKYIFVDNDLLLKYKLKKDDFILGEASVMGERGGLLDEVKNINFDNIEQSSNTKTDKKIEQLTNVLNAYEEIKNCDYEIKIAVEMEVEEYYISQMQRNCLYIASEERDDIKRSYNAVLDCKKLVRNLSNQNKPFALYLIDIDYIFNIINAYNIYSGYRNEVDAGQFIKELLIDAKNAKGSKIVVYERPRYKRNAYLDAILNKYL